MSSVSTYYVAYVGTCTCICLLYVCVIRAYVPVHVDIIIYMSSVLCVKLVCNKTRTYCAL